jgi:hypothetical protein
MTTFDDIMYYLFRLDDGNFARAQNAAMTVKCIDYVTIIPIAFGAGANVTQLSKLGGSCGVPMDALVVTAADFQEKVKCALQNVVCNTAVKC